jgi:hypothetical protein
MISAEEEKTWFKYLVETIKVILADDLGTYQLTKDPATEIPSIYVKSKELNPNQWRFKENSGVECIVHRGVQIKPEPIMGANILNMVFSVELVQRNRENSLTVSVVKMLQSKAFIIRKEPIITPQAETPVGFAFERAKIEIEVSQRMNIS